MKQCSRCKEVKSLDEFYRDKATKDNRRCRCKVCDKEMVKEWQSSNTDKLAEQATAYRKANLEKSRTSSRNYYHRNKQKQIAYKVKYNKNRRLEDPLFALTENIRSMIWSAFDGKGYSKPTRTETILGCSYFEFRDYIESLFEPWMTWSNRGYYDGTPNTGWDIDHITPISTAKDQADIVRLNHHTNLRPLCSYTNRDVKRNKLDF